jgi:hypothetical protein
VWQREAEVSGKWFMEEEDENEEEECGEDMGLEVLWIGCAETFCCDCRG